MTSEPVSKQLVTVTAADVCPTVCPCDQKNDVEPTPKPAVRTGRKRKSEPAVESINNASAESDAAMSGDFAAALAMIASLPLSDEQKAEAVCRLLKKQ